MGMRSLDRTHVLERTNGAPMLRLAAAACFAEAAGLCVAAVFNVVDLASHRTGMAGSNGAAFIVGELVVAAGVAAVGVGLAQVRPWSRTPAVLIGVFTILVAVWLLQAHRYGWGVPALLIALAELAGVFAPASLRALTRTDWPGRD